MTVASSDPRSSSVDNLLSEVPKSVSVLSVPHALQGGKFVGYRGEDPSYCSLVNSLLYDGVDCVFEEASGLRPTIAERLTKSHFEDRLNHAVGYFDIDPNGDERRKYDIPETSGGECLIDGCLSDPPHTYEWEHLPAQQKREEYWLKRIQETDFKRGLLICGVSHTLSFANRLTCAKITVNRTCIYIPYSKLCRRDHTHH